MPELNKTALMAGLFGAETEHSPSHRTVKLQLEQIRDYHSHIYAVVDDERMEELAESFRRGIGVDPITVRRHQTYGNPYECIAGHRRRYAAGKDEILGDRLGVGRATVQRLMRLTKLIDPLFELVEKKKWTKEAGSIVAGIDGEKQKILAAALSRLEKIPRITPEQALELAALAKSDNCTEATVLDAIGAKKRKATPFRLTEKDVADIFPRTYAGDKKALILTLLNDQLKDRREAVR
ncbi:MAG: ParB N-terminal domain-containing protein [Clostridiales Family XIII bacterium]|jgi:hypothetical protein|nr:ParB N-terminal domain-containing protein [Clostridiales Family XIII bacterium]